MTYTLSLRLNNKSPIELNTLTNSLNALAKEYDSFTRSEFNLTKTDRKLEIKKLEQGSLVIDLVSVIIPQMQEVNTVLTFGKYFLQGLQFFLAKDNDTVASSFSKTTCNNFSSFVDMAANDKGSNISIQVTNSNNTPLYIGNFNSVDCNALQNNINKYQKNLLAEEPSSIHYKQAFYWYSASFAASPEVGIRNNADKGIIEKFDNKPHKIIFEKDSDKILITSSHSEFSKEWQELMYVVDVEIVRIQGIIKMYKILNVHYKDTFDPEEN